MVIWCRAHINSRYINFHCRWYMITQSTHRDVLGHTNTRPHINSETVERAYEKVNWFNLNGINFPLFLLFTKIHYHTDEWFSMCLHKTKPQLSNSQRKPYSDAMRAPWTEHSSIIFYYYVRFLWFVCFYFIKLDKIECTHCWIVGW